MKYRVILTTTNPMATPKYELFACRDDSLDSVTDESLLSGQYVDAIIYCGTFTAAPGVLMDIINNHFVVTARG